MSSTLILGGVKSGKSLLAEQLASNSTLTVHYIATASANDSEMQKRIEQHQQRRPENWHSIEEPIQLASIIQQHCTRDKCVLIDCLTLWLTNLLMLDNDDILNTEIDSLIGVVSTVEGKLIMVSNETNMGITPLGELTRRYCDEAGILHQRLAKQCDNVVLTVAGLPHILKGHINDSF